MALKDTILSKLRGWGREKTNPVSEQPLATEPEAPPEKPSAQELLLTNTHPLQMLWELYATHTQQPPPLPVLRMEAPSAPAEETAKETAAPSIFGEDVEKELARLDKAITGTAERRLGKLHAVGNEPPVIDAEVQVFLTSQRMSAWLLVYPPFGGGAELDRDMLAKALEAASVRYGVDKEFLDTLPGLPEQYFHLYLAACGTLPVHGQDGYVIDSYSRQYVQALTEDESGRVDFTSLELFQNTKKGDVICQIFPPTACKDGRTVTDQVSYARTGRPATVPKGRNTELSEDGSCLIASCEGHVEFNGRSFQVKPVLEIGGNVDFSTGNLNSLGDIHIHGDVCSGFTVRATGNITVDGVIEASIVEAGGDLVVRKGVQGNNQAVLRAHRSVFAKYLESSRVHARENLETECLINCNVYSDGRVTVRSGRGTIIGGRIRAAREVSANIVGARSELPTAVILGGKPCEDFERESLIKELCEMEENLNRLSRQPDSPNKQRQMSKMRLQISANKMKLQQLDKELEKERREILPNRENGRLICGTVYPGAEITIGMASLKVAHETVGCTAVLVGGEVILS